MSALLYWQSGIQLWLNFRVLFTSAAAIFFFAYFVCPLGGAGGPCEPLHLRLVAILHLIHGCIVILLLYNSISPFSSLQEISQTWATTRCPKRRSVEEESLQRPPLSRRGTTRRRATAAPVSTDLWPVTHHQLFHSTVASRKEKKFNPTLSFNG